MKKLLTFPWSQPSNPYMECTDKSIINVADAYASSMGTLGGVLLTTTTQINGEFSGMIVLEDATFTTLTIDGYTKNSLVTPAVGADWGTLPQGFSLGGHITVCKLTSGKVLLVK